MSTDCVLDYNPRPESHFRARQPTSLSKLISGMPNIEEVFVTHDWLSGRAPKLKPPYAAVSRKYIAKEKRIGDPTRLILVDEADRLKIVSLEQMRAIFDAGGIGLMLIGMPGIEKRMARYPQFYSRIGFVHEFRPLGATEMRKPLSKSWTPPGVSLPEMDSDAVTSVIRITVYSC